MATNFFDAFSAALPQGLQLGQRQQELQDLREERERRAKLGEIQTIGEVAGMLPGPEKDFAVGMLQNYHKERGTGLPSFFWQEMKKADEESAKGWQQMADQLAASGWKIGARELGHILRKDPGFGLKLLQQAREEQWLAGEPGRAGTVGAAIGMPSPAPTPGPATPPTPNLALLAPGELARTEAFPVEGGLAAQVGGGVRRWAPQLVRYGQEYGVDPRYLAAQMQVESGGDPRAVGPATKYGTAKGAMQFIDATAERYDLTDPFDPEQSVRAAAAYNRDLFRLAGGDPHKAAFLYHAGEGALPEYGDRAKHPKSMAYADRVVGLAQQYGYQPGAVTPTAGAPTPTAPPPEIAAIDARLAVLEPKIHYWQGKPGEFAQQYADRYVKERDRLEARRDRLQEQGYKREEREERQEQTRSVNAAERYAGSMFNMPYARLAPAQKEQVNRRIREEDLEAKRQEGQAKADVAVENLRYTPQQQTQLQTLNDNLTAAETLREVPDEALDRWVGYLKNPAERVRQLFEADRDFQAFQAQVNQLRAGLLFSRTEGGGGALTETELRALESFIPTGQEAGGKTAFKAKLAQLIGRLERKLSTIEGLAKAKPGEATDILAEQRRQAAEARRQAREAEPAGGTHPVVEVAPGVTIQRTK